MKHIKKFESQENEFDENKSEILDNIKQFITDSHLDAELDEVDEYSYRLVIKKSNSCFNSEEMKNQFSSDMMSGVGDGYAKAGFMSDYTTIEDMYGQIRVIESISNSLEDFGIRTDRIYLGGDNIFIEFNLE